VALRIVGGLVLVLALAWFAAANGDQTVDVRFGLFTLRGLSVPVVIFGSVIVGMLIMLVAGLRTDASPDSAGRGMGEGRAGAASADD
jgi:uncharacterized integral membrane protein